MMDKISGTTGWGMEPSISSDGLLSMLFESGEGFATAFDSALLATEPMDGEGTLVSPDAEMQDGLQLMETEWNAVVMPGLTPVEVTQVAVGGASQVAPLTSDASQMVASGEVTNTEGMMNPDASLVDDGADAFLGDRSGVNSELLAQQTIEPAEWTQADTSDATSFAHTTEQAQTSVVAAATTVKGGASSKANATVRSDKGVESPADVRLDEEGVESTRPVTQAAEMGDVDEELGQEWDSSHLQLEGEFEPLAANSPFPKQALPQSMDPRVVIEADSLDAVDNDGPTDVNGTQTKGAVSKTAEPQVAFEEEFENPSDALVDLSEQRTVRVVVDQDLAVEVSQDGEAIDVVVEGAQDVTDNIREGAAEIADTLEESGMHLRDFTARRDSSEQGQTTSSQRMSGGDGADGEEVVDAAPIPRGQAVNIVA